MRSSMSKLIKNFNFRIANLMREYCNEAKQYGYAKVQPNGKLKKVLVVLNPAANKRNAEENFNDFCAPILNLAGYMIDIVKTEAENHAIRYFEEELKEYPDVIVIGGGDGSITEVLTGVMRKAESQGEAIPTIGVLPLGQFNQFSLHLINGTAKFNNKVENVKAMAEAALSVVRGNSVKKDIMKIELISEDQEDVKKPFFAVGSIHFGAFNDILRKRDKYWTTGGLRNYSAMLFNGAFERAGITWECKAKMTYSPPCEGCSNCYQKVESNQQKLQNSRWWSKFNAKEKVPEYSKILNPNCMTTFEVDFETSELAITSNTMENKNQDPSQLNVKINSAQNDHGLSYVWNGWKRIANRTFLDVPDSKNFSARQLTLFPSVSSEEGNEKLFTIDFNTFELRPIKVTVMPKRINFFAMQ